MFRCTYMHILVYLFLNSFVVFFFYWASSDSRSLLHFEVMASQLWTCGFRGPDLAGGVWSLAQHGQKVRSLRNDDCKPPVLYYIFHDIPGSCNCFVSDYIPLYPTISHYIPTQSLRICYFSQLLIANPLYPTSIPL